MSGSGGERVDSAGKTAKMQAWIDEDNMLCEAGTAGEQDRGSQQSQTINSACIGGFEPSHWGLG